MSFEITINEKAKYNLREGEAKEDINTIGKRYAQIYQKSNELVSPIISVILRNNGTIIARTWLNSKKDYEEVDRSKLVNSIQIGHIVNTYYQNPVMLENESRFMAGVAKLFLDNYKVRGKVNVIITYRFPRNNGKTVVSNWYERGSRSVIEAIPILRNYGPVIAESFFSPATNNAMECILSSERDYGRREYPWSIDSDCDDFGY